MRHRELGMRRRAPERLCQSRGVLLGISVRAQRCGRRVRRIIHDAAIFQTSAPNIVPGVVGKLIGTNSGRLHVHRVWIAAGFKILKIREVGSGPRLDVWVKKTATRTARSSPPARPTPTPPPPPPLPPTLPPQRP